MGDEEWSGGERGQGAKHGSSPGHLMRMRNKAVGQTGKVFEEVEAEELGD